jgi:hypothetical protein
MPNATVKTVTVAINAPVKAALVDVVVVNSTTVG